jgi:hypothetical protein
LERPVRLIKRLAVLERDRFEVRAQARIILARQQREQPVDRRGVFGCLAAFPAYACALARSLCQDISAPILSGFELLAFQDQNTLKKFAPAGVGFKHQLMLNIGDVLCRNQTQCGLTVSPLAHVRLHRRWNETPGFGIRRQSSLLI